MQHARRASALVGALALIVAASACGGRDAGDARADGGRTTAGGQNARDMQEAMLDYAECMRENGVDMPDPQGGGFVITPDSDPSQGDREAFRKADAKCRTHLRNVKPPELSEEQKQAFEKAALEHARCMREHGIDLPDPTMNEGGGAAVSLDGIDLDDPKFKKAQKACEGKLREVGDPLKGGRDE